MNFTQQEAFMSIKVLAKAIKLVAESDISERDHVAAVTAVLVGAVEQVTPALTPEMRAELFLHSGG